ncbi:MAG: hypothetical protein H6564_00305 [Lewinellaceae bacterium]|nr:hypothetical protein [Lewinellaceae bacterium]
MRTAPYSENGKRQSRRPEAERAYLAALLSLCLGLLLSSCHVTQAQPAPVDSFRLLHILPLEAKWFTVDKLQQAYLVTSRNAVAKFGPDGKELFRYNNNTRGELASIDATDPFNLLLFYPDLQGIATLDRTMNETGWLLLFSAGIVNASAVALAPDNNIWVYDQATFQLRKIAPDGTVLATTENLSAQMLQPPYASQALARENFVFLYGPTQGVFLFDNFGQFYRLLELPGYQQFQVQGETLLLYTPGDYRAYSLDRLQSAALPLPERGRHAKQVAWQGRLLYLLNEKGMVEVYERL